MFELGFKIPNVFLNLRILDSWKKKAHPTITKLITTNAISIFAILFLNCIGPPFHSLVRACSSYQNSNFPTNIQHSEVDILSINKKPEWTKSFGLWYCVKTFSYDSGFNTTVTYFLVFNIFLASFWTSLAVTASTFWLNLSGVVASASFSAYFFSSPNQ